MELGVGSLVPQGALLPSKAEVARFAAAKVKFMQDMKASAEKLRAEADYAEQIARSATAAQKRELYERLAVHFRQLASDIEKVMADSMK
jgi:hypothetical protein